jgi:hypothetical protein
MSFNDEVDGWISQLMQCKPLSEAEVKKLCDKVSEDRTCGRCFRPDEGAGVREGMMWNQGARGVRVVVCLMRLHSRDVDAGHVLRQWGRFDVEHKKKGRDVASAWAA